MDYKEKYEQAISRMNKWVEGSEITDPKEVAEFVFPELKEREIGRIKTNIIKLLRFVRDTNHQYSDECNEAIDWLEKQKDAKKEYWIGYIEGKKEILEQCSKSSDSKNEMIRKAIFKALSKKDARDVLLANGVQVSDALTWVEMHAEQSNPYSGISFKYNGHTWGMCARDNGVDVLFDSQLLKHLEMLGEQISTDKVEPKFKVGDWITNGIDTDKIIDIRSDEENYVFENGRKSDIRLNDCSCHLWTIQDAKDGDVLLSPSTPEGDKECPFIFKEVDKNGIVRCYVALLQSEHLKIDDGVTNVMGYANAGYHTPATKEQRDFLFQKMHEAGYEWDAEKKELKKIESVQPELPNGEDYGIDSLYHAARILEKTLGNVDGYQSDDGILEHQCAIEAVNRLYKQKTTWSEEDEKMLKFSLENLTELKNRFGEKYGKVGDCILWLKSLKERYTWKSSDEQKTIDIEKGLRLVEN